MAKRIGVSIVIAMWLQGCANVPDPADIPRIEPYDLATNFLCEFHDAIEARHLPPNHFVFKSDIAFQLILTAEENRDQTGNVTFVWPIQFGNFTLALDGGAKRQRIAEHKVKFAQGFDTIKTLKHCEHSDPTAAHFYPILGTLGLDRVLDRFIAMHEISEASTNEDFIHTLEFHLDFNEGIKPSFSIEPAKGRSISGELNSKADRKDRHKLSMALSTRQPAAKKEKTEVIRVEITNLPPSAPSALSPNVSAPPAPTVKIIPRVIEERGDARRQNQERLLRSLERERGLQLEEDIRDRLRELD